MRFPEIEPTKLTAAQKPFHDEMVNLLDSKFSGFILTRSDGALERFPIVPNRKRFLRRGRM